jgi:hypothetical protein
MPSTVIGVHHNRPNRGFSVMVRSTSRTGTTALAGMAAAALAVSLVSLQLAMSLPGQQPAPLSASPEQSADDERLGIVWRGR